MPFSIRNENKNHLCLRVAFDHFSELIDRISGPIGLPVGSPAFICQTAIFERINNVGISGELLLDAPVLEQPKIYLSSKREFDK
jgi:hypothetical protein